MKTLDQLIEESKSHIRKALDADPSNVRAFVGTSFGKDSLTITELAREVMAERGYGDIPLVHNPKAAPATHPETMTFAYYYCIENAVQFIPGSQMIDFINNNGFVLQVDGTRRAEFSRTDKSNDFIKDGKSVNRTEIEPYIENGIFGLNIVFPILDWEDHHVFEFLASRDIFLSPEYQGEYAKISSFYNIR